MMHQQRTSLKRKRNEATLTSVLFCLSICASEVTPMSPILFWFKVSVRTTLLSLSALARSRASSSARRASVKRIVMSNGLLSEICCANFSNSRSALRVRFFCLGRIKEV